MINTKTKANPSSSINEALSINCATFRLKGNKIYVGDCVFLAHEMYRSTFTTFLESIGFTDVHITRINTWLTANNF